MYYKEAWRNGKLYCTISPNGEWIPFTIGQYKARVLELEEKVKNLTLPLVSKSVSLEGNNTMINHLNYTIMTTIKTKLNGNFDLNDDQFNVCSLLATLEKRADKGDNNKINGVSWCANLIKVPWQVLYDIQIERNFSGYKDMFRLSESVYF